MRDVADPTPIVRDELPRRERHLRGRLGPLARLGDDAIAVSEKMIGMSKSLRVATWNMDYWRRRSASAQDGAWDYVDRVLRADLLLLLEAREPEGRRVVYGAREIYRGQGWASLVVSEPSAEAVQRARARQSMRDVDLHRSFPGCLAIARITLPGGWPPTAISVYGKTEDGYAQTTMHSLLNDLIPLIDESGSRQNRWIVMGGDLNVSTQLPAPYGRWSRSIFDRIEGFGLVDLAAATVARRPELRIEDCSCGENDCGHVQTCTQRPAGSATRTTTCSQAPHSRIASRTATSCRTERSSPTTGPS